MQVLRPQTLGEALEMRAANPGAVPVAGGTDVMVDLNLGRLRPDTLVDLSRIPELDEWHVDGGWVFLGSGVTYTRVIRQLRDQVALVQACRSIGSVQIRNRGTVGGNLGTASPAGDTLPVLAAYDAEIVLARAGGDPRSLPWNEFLVGPKSTSIRPGELILGVRWKARRGFGSFAKIGTRNAMVISVAGLCLQFDEDAGEVHVALGSVAPTVVRAPRAEAFAAGLLAEARAWDDPTVGIGEADVGHFAELVAGAARPIDDMRGTAAYRRHVCTVLARRALSNALVERAAGAGL